MYPSAEIYNGYSGFWDYGPLGVEMRRNIKNLWWKRFVRSRDDIVGLDSSIITSPSVWRASGHVDGFSDPLVDCRETKRRFRADQLIFARASLSDPKAATTHSIGFVCVYEPEAGRDIRGALLARAYDAAKAAVKRGDVNFSGDRPRREDVFVDGLQPVSEAPADLIADIPSPETGKAGDLTAPRDFNLMFETKVGSVADEAGTSYLRPETAQGIFANFRNVQASARMKLPFGIAQIGKAFRNEITPRNFIFRSREFEQMEIEYFVSPEATGDEGWAEQHQAWVDEMKDFLVTIGIDQDLITLEKHDDGDLAHYARACTDILFSYPFGTQELLGVAARGDYDLQRHREASGAKLEYFDAVTNKRYVPHVIEPSLGVDRLMLALLVSAYHKDVVSGEERTVLKLHPSIAPVQAAVLPLMKKPPLVKCAREVLAGLRPDLNVEWDQSGAIGRRYRRMDEIGTPFCITVDFETLDDGTVTVRDRDTTEQVRKPISELRGYLMERLQ